MVGLVDDTKQINGHMCKYIQHKFGNTLRLKKKKTNVQFKSI